MLKSFQRLEMTFSFSKSIHCHVADLSEKKQNVSTINTIYRFKDSLVKLLMVALVNNFDTHRTEALNLPCIKLFMYVRGIRMDGDATHWFCWRSYTTKHSITASLSVSTEKASHKARSTSGTASFLEKLGVMYLKYTHCLVLDQAQKGRPVLTMKSKHLQLRDVYAVSFKLLWSWAVDVSVSPDSANLSNLTGTCQTSFSLAAQWKLIIRQSINLHNWSQM